MSKQPPPQPDQKPTFEQKLSELEAVVKQLEGSDVPLEEALLLFERGTQLSEACRKDLAEAEMRVEILIKKHRTVEPQPLDQEGQ